MSLFPAAVAGADPIAACHRPWQQLRQQVEGGSPAQLVAGLSLWACLAAVLQGVLLEPEHGELDDAALQAHLNFAQVGTGDAPYSSNNAVPDALPEMPGAQRQVVSHGEVCCSGCM